ncbi:MAG: HAMP domain-containing histidine kinase [Candidatus Levybacteria bacterium]|nr:HAMP domain-containing histidine kinase [Candidatus Levybacteria bacterium]
MEKNFSEQDKLYSRLYSYSKKYIPYKWLGKLGLDNINQQQITHLLTSYGLPVVLSTIALLTTYIFKFYPDKIPFYMLYSIFVALSSWYGGLGGGVLTTGIIASGVVFFLSSNIQYELTGSLLIGLLSFIVSAVTVSFLIGTARRTNEIKKFKEQEKAYSQTFTQLFGEHIKARKEIKARDEFLSIVSHELKTPLTSMLLKLHGMLNSVYNVSLANFSVRELMQVLENAEKQIKWLTAMINDLINVSLITTGRMNLKIEDVDLVGTTNRVLQNFSELLKREKYKIRIEAKSPVVGRWDEVRIEQAITNLVSNAIKYGRGEPIDIKILKTGDSARFIIQDRGIGIHPNEQKVIFDLFKRAEEQNGNHKGLGVGLYITSQIVKVHGGSIRVSSAPMKGSLFTIDLPLNQSVKE